MTQLRFLPAVLASSSVFLLTSVSSALLAPPPQPAEASCSVNADCGKGYECTVVGGSGCAAPACAPGASCPPPEPCKPTEIKACTPARCAADADCADGMLCHKWTEACPAVDCVCSSNTPKCDCPQPACDPTVLSICTPRYVLPCAAAADCGSGFTCEEQQSCTCSGSAGGAAPPAGSAGAAPSDVAAPLPKPSCSCSPSGVFQCVPKEIPCSADAQCPAGWGCRTEVAVSAPPCLAPDCKTEPSPEPQPSVCLPNYYGAQGGKDLQVPESPRGGTPAGGPGSGAPGAPPSSPEPNSGAPESGGDRKANESSACEIGHAPASRGAFGLLLVAAAVLGLKRRRAQS